MLNVRERVAARPQLRTRRNVSKLRRFLPIALVAQDAILIYAALMLAYWTRYDLRLGPRIDAVIPFSQYQRVALLLLSIMMPVLLVKGAYRNRLDIEMVDKITTIFSAATTTVASIIVITFMFHQYEYSRGVIVYLWLSLIVLLVMGRSLFHSFQILCYRRGWDIRKLIVVGATDAGKMLMQSVRNRPDLGYEIVGFVDRRDHTRVPSFGRFQRLGTIDDLPELIEREDVDEVIVALPGSAHDKVWPIVQMCEASNVRLKLVPDLFEISLGRVTLDGVGGIPLLDVQDRPFRAVSRAIKRGMDLLIGSLILVMSLPLFAMLALLIRLDSAGPVFVKQERVGRNGSRFTCWKLRTMHVDADKMLTVLQSQNEAAGPMFKMRNDPRITRTGRYIRRLSLDELPQAWNVVRGDMSLVGPRPPLPHEVERYEDWQLRRLDITPGVTGIWQVSGRSDLSFDEMVMMDIYYVDNWSLGLDLKILRRTVRAVLAARGAY